MPSLLERDAQGWVHPLTFFVWNLWLWGRAAAKGWSYYRPLGGDPHQGG